MATFANATTKQFQGNKMADNGDMQMHDQTYHGFLTLLKVGTAASIILAAIVIFVIAN